MYNPSPPTAEDIGFSPSAVNRETKRNSGAKGYRSKQAGDKAAARRLNQRRGHRIRGDLAVEIESRLRCRHSPEQVAGALAREGVDGPSRETIYAYIAADKKAGGDLHTFLRINGKRRYRRRCKGSREKIKDRVDISERPASVDARRFFGDWEVDLVAGTRGTGYILTLAERKGRFTLLEWLPDKSAGVVAAAIVRKLRGWRVRTLTYDNGTEFSRHLEAGTTTACATADANRAGEGAVGAAFVTKHPCAETRVGDRSAGRVTRVNEVVALLVCALSRGDRTDDGGFVHLLGETGHVLREENALSVGRDGRNVAADCRICVGLRIEGVDVAHAPGHVEEDHIPGRRLLAGCLRCREELILERVRKQADAEAGFCCARNKPAAAYFV